MSTLKVLKLGWEFPPHSHGGLGVACEGLVRGLTKNNVEVILVLPRHPDVTIERCNIFSTDGSGSLEIYAIDSPLIPYMTSQAYHKYLQGDRSRKDSLYGENIFAEIERYAQTVAAFAASHDFDLIHAHDWMSMKAGILAKKASGKPLILHIHSTEFDRSGGNNINEGVYNLEREGMQKADSIIAVSNYAKNKIVEHYSIDPHKITVVHNAVADEDHHVDVDNIDDSKPLVLFLGRLTLQKGPDYFIRAALEVLAHRPNTTFVIAGEGNMEHQLMEWVATAGMADKILFTGNLNRPEVQRAYRMANLYVMPSVSDPFGIAALEAMRNGTPVIISKQSGVSEVVNHALRVDFWDIHEMVNKIIGVIDHRQLRDELSTNAQAESQKFSWESVAGQCINVYKKHLF